MQNVRTITKNKKKRFLSRPEKKKKIRIKKKKIVDQNKKFAFSLKIQLYFGVSGVGELGIIN
jgi:hypothetical protein